MDSMRQLFTRQNLPGQIVSLRHALAAHAGGQRMGLREASTTFTTLHTSSGFESGCREPNDIEIGIGIGGKNMGQLFPSWVAVRFNSFAFQNAGGRSGEEQDHQGRFSAEAVAYVLRLEFLRPGRSCSSATC